jgi:hypothetical protein
MIATSSQPAWMIGNADDSNRMDIAQGVVLVRCCGFTALP